MIPQSWLDDVIDEDAFLERVDPDWRSHYPCVDVAMDHITYMHPEEFHKIRKELKGSGVFRD